MKGLCWWAAQSGVIRFDCLGHKRVIDIIIAIIKLSAVIGVYHVKDQRTTRREEGEEEKEGEERIKMNEHSEVLDQRMERQIVT